MKQTTPKPTLLSTTEGGESIILRELEKNIRMEKYRNIFFVTAKVMLSRQYY